MVVANKSKIMAAIRVEEDDADVLLMASFYWTLVIFRGKIDWWEIDKVDIIIGGAQWIERRRWFWILRIVFGDAWGGWWWRSGGLFHAGPWLALLRISHVQLLVKARRLVLISPSLPLLLFLVFSSLRLFSIDILIQKKGETEGERRGLIYRNHDSCDLNEEGHLVGECRLDQTVAPCFYYLEDGMWY